MYKELNIEETKGDLNLRFVKITERKMCDSVAYGILEFLEQDVVIGCVYTDGSFNRLYEMALFLKGRTDELPVANDFVLKDFDVAVF